MKLKLRNSQLSVLPYFNRFAKWIKINWATFSSSLFQPTLNKNTVMQRNFQFFLISTRKLRCVIEKPLAFSSSLFQLILDAVAERAMIAFSSSLFQQKFLNLESVYYIAFSSSLFQLISAFREVFWFDFQFFLISTWAKDFRLFGKKLSVLPYFNR